VIGIEREAKAQQTQAPGLGLSARGLPFAFLSFLQEPLDSRLLANSPEDLFAVRFADIYIFFIDVGRVDARTAVN
jgi:hypothetical protein